MQLVSIDFHNTLFQCDEWFQLEIESLPVAYLKRSGMIPPDEAGGASMIARNARAAYRAIRQRVMASGRECDAVTCVRSVLQDLHVDATNEDVEQGVREIMHATLDSARPIPGAMELVSHLEDLDLGVAVISSAAYHPFLEWCLEHYGMRDAFQAIVSSAACGIYKSDPSIYRYTLELFATRPENAVHIGDSHRFDVASARESGMRTILLTADIDTPRDPEPDALVSHLGEVPEHLDRLLGNLQKT